MIPFTLARVPSELSNVARGNSLSARHQKYPLPVLASPLAEVQGEARHDGYYSYGRYDTLAGHGRGSRRARCDGVYRPSL